jgi:hypothetical protein
LKYVEAKTRAKSKKKKKLSIWLIIPYFNNLNVITKIIAKIPSSFFTEMFFLYIFAKIQNQNQISHYFPLKKKQVRT